MPNVSGKMRLLYKDIKDASTSESLARVEAAWNDEPLLKGRFQFREFTLAAPSYPATVSIPHKLLYVPRDIVQTSIIGGTVTWQYQKFTQTALVATISAPTVVRAFIGTYSEG